MPMLVNIHHGSRREHVKLLVSGVVFLTIIAMLIALSLAMYNKAFTSVTTITIKADRAGLQLTKFGDVRQNGALVGQVRDVSQDGKQASITVALTPSAAEEIPANVKVEILPTTLFGQKFISFVKPDNPSKDSLQDGDTIPSDRVNTNVELSRILAELFPLLRAVKPADLNMTLSALANALEGRGDQIGRTMDDLGQYLDAIEGSLPTLRQDLIALADVADTYDSAAPDLLQLLGNLTVTSRTIIQKEQALDTFFGDLTTLANTTRTVLSDNEDALIRSGQVGAPVLKLLAAYSPELPCLLVGADRYEPLLAGTFEGNQIKQFIEFGTNQYSAYDRNDLPEYGEIGHGPWCSGLPNPPVPIGPIRLKDGADNEPNGGPAGLSPRAVPAWAAQAGFGAGMTSGYAGTEGDQQVLNALLAGESGRPVGSYGSLGSLLYGPVVRGEGTS